jgi:hypothetical protein
MLTLWHAAGRRTTPTWDRRFLSSLDDATSRAGTNADTEYAMDKAGKSRSSVEANAEGEKIAAPVYTSQGGGALHPEVHGVQVDGAAVARRHGSLRRED